MPYSCYFSTEIPSRVFGRSASLEGRLSPFSASSATYQSLEGLISDREESQYGGSGRCSGCGSRSSVNSLSRKLRQQRYHQFNCIPSGSVQSSTHQFIDKKPYNKAHIILNSSSRSDSRSSLSSQKKELHHYCPESPTPSLIPKDKPNFYLNHCTPNFYGWSSPPGSPSSIFQGSVHSIDCEGVSLDGIDGVSSVYAGSVAPSMDINWCPEESLYNGSNISEILPATEDKIKTTDNQKALLGLNTKLLTPIIVPQIIIKSPSEEEAKAYSVEPVSPDNLSNSTDVRKITDTTNEDNFDKEQKKPSMDKSFNADDSGMFSSSSKDSFLLFNSDTVHLMDDKQTKL